jgi:hypothetical protein
MDPESPPTPDGLETPTQTGAGPPSLARGPGSPDPNGHPPGFPGATDVPFRDSINIINSINQTTNITNITNATPSIPAAKGTPARSTFRNLLVFPTTPALAAFLTPT